MTTQIGHMPARTPAQPAGGVPLPFPFPNTPEARKAVGALRKAARAEIERLVAFLDRTEGECDLEDGGDAEPSLGWTSMEAGYGRYANGDDLEEEHDGREDQCEDEGAQCEGGGEDDERESDPAEMGICDADAADEFAGENAAITAFRDDRAIRLTGRSIPEPAWTGSIPRHINEAYGEPDMLNPMVDGTWLLMHHGDQHQLTKLEPEARP